MIGLLIALALCCNPSASLCPKQLPAAIDTILGDPSFAPSTWRLNITYLDGNSVLQPLYSHMPRVLGSSASNNKCLTCSTAYQTLGPQFRFESKLWFNSDSRTLCWQGSGDPTVSHNTLAALPPIVTAKMNLSSVLAVQVDDSLFGLQAVNG